MEAEKLMMFLVATVVLITGVSAQSIQVDGLQAEEVNASFGDREVTFTASYLNKSITYGKLLVPDELRGDLVDLRSNGRVRTVVDGVGIFQPPGQQDRRLSLAYKFRNDASVPELQGWQYGEFSGNRNSGLKPKNGEGTLLLDAEDRDRIFTSNFSDQGVRWNITVESHYEHLIVNYDLIYNGSVQDSFQDVYSGEDTERLPASGNLLKYERNGEYQDRISLNYDRRYESGEKEVTVAALHENSREFREFQSSTGSFEQVDSSGVYSRVEEQAEQVGATDVLVDDISKYDVKAFNVTVPGNSTARFEAFVESPETVQQDMSMYVLGSFAGGSGTSSDPYQIETCQQLQDMNNNLSASYELVSDIDCSDTSNWNEGPFGDQPPKGFAPIGRYYEGSTYVDTKFSGVLNGNGHIISDLFISRENEEYVGLFGFLTDSAVVKNVGLTGVDIEGAGDTGGLSGYTKGYIDNVFVEGSVSGGNYSGGIVGYAKDPVIFNNTYSIVDVNGGDEVGGITSTALGDIKGVYSVGDINASGEVDPIARDLSGTQRGFFDVDSTGLSTTTTYAKNLTTSQATGGSVKEYVEGFEGGFYFSDGPWETVNESEEGFDGYPILEVFDKQKQLEIQPSYLKNAAPSINSQRIIWGNIGGSEAKKVNYSFSDPDGDDISSHNTLPEGSEEKFTNSTLKVSGISSPFDYLAQITDFAGATVSIETNYTFSDTGYREDGYSHDLETQQVNLSSTIENRGASSDYELGHANPSGYSSIVQGTSWSGTLTSSETITKTSVWSGDWITGETESTYDRYEDSGFDHDEDMQVLVNQTQLVVDNQRSFRFSSVDLSSICSQTSTADIVSGSNVVATSDCNRPTFTVDFIDQSVGSLFEDGTVAHDLDSQGVSRVKNLTETGGNSWTGVNVSSPEMPGSCVNCGQREVDVAADSTSAVYYNSTGDWIDSSVEVFEKGQYGVADLDQQSFYNQTSLEASNSQSFRFNSVDLSSKCSVTTSGDVPPGSSTVTTACTNSTFSGDWIQNEVNESTRFQEGSVVIGDGVSELYRAGQNVSVENTRSDVNLTVDFSGQLVEEQSCSVVDSVRKVRASTAAEFQFEKLCSPGEVVSHEPVQKTDTATDFKYTYRGKFELYTNLTEEEPITFAVEKSRLSNYEERLPTETEVYVDGRNSGLSVGQRYFNDTEYVTIEVPDDFGNSSLHEGSHSVKLVYYESKSPGGTSGGASTGSIVGGSSSVQETVENVTGEYNWTVSAAVASDTQKFTVARAPGDTFEKQILLENTGSSEVPLNISCTSQEDFCRYVNLGVDRVVLNTGSFSQKQVTVSGNIPANASAGSSYTFRILVEDPSSNGLGSDGAATVDFLVTVSDFWGGIISYAGKLTEMRELQPPFGVGSPIPYPFALLPVLSAVVVGGFSWGLRRLLEIEASTKVQILDFALVVFTFLVSVPLWP